MEFFYECSFPLEVDYELTSIGGSFMWDQLVLVIYSNGVNDTNTFLFNL